MSDNDQLHVDGANQVEEGKCRHAYDRSGTVCNTPRPMKGKIELGQHTVKMSEKRFAGLSDRCRNCCEVLGLDDKEFERNEVDIDINAFFGDDEPEDVTTEVETVGVTPDTDEEMVRSIDKVGVTPSTEESPVGSEDDNDETAQLT